MKDNLLNLEFEFTKVHKKYKNSDKALRELECLKVLFPEILGNMAPGDLIAGKISYPYVGYSIERGGFCYYCKFEELDKIEKERPELKDRIKELKDYWSEEDTVKKAQKKYPREKYGELCNNNFYRNSGIMFPMYRIAGLCLDYDKLIKSGIGGLKENLEKRISVCTDEEKEFLKASRESLDVVSQSCIYYSRQAEKIADNTDNPEIKKRSEKLSAVLRRISNDKPQSFWEGVQLFWIYSILAGVINYGRMDDYLGELYAHDIDSGVMEENEAQEIINSLWKLMAENGNEYNNRVIIGGRGRKNENTADRFALAAMRATQNIMEPIPQLTLRIYDGMDGRLKEKAMEIIDDGRGFPILYNDDVVINNVMNAFGVGEAEAVQYIPYGCGEYIINHKSIGSPNAIVNCLELLNKIILSNENYGSYDELFESYKKEFSEYMDLAAQIEKESYETFAQNASVLLPGILYDNCIENGKGMLDGGVKYLGATVETYGNINTGNSLAAIKKAVFDEKQLTLKRIAEVMGKDFEGYEEERRILLDAPKYGNDNEYVDEIQKELHNAVCTIIKEKAQKVQLHSCMAVLINNSVNTVMGRNTGASADGRKSGCYMANANNPFNGTDVNGVTAMLNSLVKLSGNIHAGAVQNIKFSRGIYEKSGEKVRALLETYFKNGGAQIMVTVADNETLRKAYENPRGYENIFVRVGGFSARFVTLEKDIQLEILNRTCI